MPRDVTRLAVRTLLDGLAERVPGRAVEPAFNMQSLGRYLFREQAVNLELAGPILNPRQVGAILIARPRGGHRARPRPRLP